MSSRLSKRYLDQRSVPESTPRTPISVLLHIVALASHVNSFRLLFQPSPVSEFMSGQKGGQWGYLTILSLAVSLLTFVAALLKDLFPAHKGLDRLKTSLSVIAVPVEGLVSVLYWTMQAIDPSLLTPENAIFKIPLFLDLSIHAFPAIFLWTDFLVFSPRMSRKANPLLISTIATIAYTLWMEYTASHNGRFPYPFLDAMKPLARIIFYGVMVPVLLGLFYLSNAVHDAIRGRDGRTQAHIAAKAQKKVDSKVQ